MRFQSFRTRGTGYFLPGPHGYASEAEARMEGGDKDRRGARLHSLQEYLRGDAPFASVAMDSTALAYGTKIIIPELDLLYASSIIFRAVDTGGAFKGKGLSRMDFCCDTRFESLSADINKSLLCVAIIEED